MYLQYSRLAFVLEAMKTIIFFLLVPIFLGFSCSENVKKLGVSTQVIQLDSNQVILFDTLKLFDSARSRQIPIALYSQKNNGDVMQPVLIFSHGYGQNNGQSYLKYSYLMNFFALRGYYVVSIQHENFGDPLLAYKGDIQKLRLPVWERGCENINFILEYLAKKENLDLNKLTLVGHSNGGDMSALFVEQNPGRVHQLILLDNLRKQIPAHINTAVLNLRAIDTKADPGVLKNAYLKSVENHSLVHLKYTKHAEMDDKSNGEQREEIMQSIIKFISRNP